MPKNKDVQNLERALSAFDIQLDSLNFIERDALSIRHNRTTVIHETDRTPRVVLPGGSSRPRENCTLRQSSLDIGGVARTGSNGRDRWRITEYLCGPDPTLQDYENPVSFIVTALSSDPIFLTARQREVGTDVEFVVFSWTLGGDPAPSVRYSWRCWVQHIDRID